jgi:FixJ family two-component response regulator
MATWTGASYPNRRQEVSPLVAVVDDEYSVRRALVRLVKSAGLSVQGLASAEEFLESHSIRPYDCLILDIRLQGMSGLELQRRLTATGHVLPIIFVTACDEVEARSLSLAGGAHAFFAKPVNDEVLLRAIRSALQSYDSVVC